MRIEGFLVLPFQGQFRFGFEVSYEGRHLKIGDLLQSKMPYDYFWDVRLRSRPTVFELIENEPRVALLWPEYWKSLMVEFKYATEEILNAPNKRIKKFIGAPYVEFIFIQD